MTEKFIPSIETIRQLVSYDANTGNLTWLSRPEGGIVLDGVQLSSRACKSFNGYLAGKPAISHVSNKGYLIGNIVGSRFSAHRVAWALHFGEWPNGDIDHIDRDRSNNKISNLRIATKSQNGANRTKKAGTSSRFLGVYKRSDTGKYVAQMHQTKLGNFECEIEAARAYNAEAIKKYGEFANLNDV